MEAATKDGREITFRREENVEGKRTNRGWRVDKVTAFVGGEEAGYLSISYIPKEAFKYFYPSIINFVDQINGQPLLPHGKDHLHYTQLDDDELRKMIKTAFHYNARHELSYDFERREESYQGRFISEMTHEELLAVAKRVEEMMKENFMDGKRGFKWFKSYFVDRPLVDFIRVYNEHDKGTNWQRQGIGTALYKEGTKWMAERGMKLYGSQTPSQSAQATWDSMRKKGIVKKDRRGHYIGNTDG